MGHSQRACHDRLNAIRFYLNLLLHPFALSESLYSVTGGYLPDSNVRQLARTLEDARRRCRSACEFRTANHTLQIVCHFTGRCRELGSRAVVMFTFLQSTLSQSSFTSYRTRDRSNRALHCKLSS